MTEGELRELSVQLLNRRHKRPGDVAMEALKRDGMLVAPGTYCPRDTQSAREIYEQRKATGRRCTFNAGYGSGWAISNMLWGKPDMGFHTRDMMTLIGRYLIAAAYPLPVIFDAETGFCIEPVTITETVQAYDSMAVAVMHVEDQRTRRCGNTGGKECEDIGDMIVKIKHVLSAIDALDSSMRLMVRTDALTAVGGGLENAIERGKRYMDVEVRGLRPTMLWADAMMDPEIIDKWIAAMRAHDPDMILAINYSPNKDWTGYYQKKFDRNPPTYSDLHRDGKGFKVIFHTILTSRAAMRATWDVLEDMAENGAEALWKLHESQRGHPVADAQAMSNFPAWQKVDEHIGGDAARERYEKSEGYGKK